MLIGVKTVIMAGGQGTRIAEIYPNIPKPLIPIKDKNGSEKPILEREIESISSQGFKDIILTVSYMADQIEHYFGDGSRFGVKIQYFVEDEPLGNAGALFKVRDILGNEPFLLLIADALFDVDFTKMVEYHNSKKALVTVFTHPNSHPFDSSLLVSDADGRVVSWITKEDCRPKYYKNRVNAGLQVIDPAALDLAIQRMGIRTEDLGTVGPDGKTIKVDLDRDVLKPLCESKKIFIYDSPEYCKDMGTPERFKQVSKDFQNGIVGAKNGRKPQKAIFLDRDGTLNQYVGFLRKSEELELIEGAAEAIKLINQSEYLAIVITNQPVIARGEVTIEGLREIHNKLETLLGKVGAYLDGIYYCPHHPDKGYKGEITELKIQCKCRKPSPGLILRACSDFNICLKDSWMIGDGENDIKAGKAAGCKTILVGDSDDVDCVADAYASDVKAAVKIILKN